MCYVWDARSQTVRKELEVIVLTYATRKISGNAYKVVHPNPKYANHRSQHPKLSSLRFRQLVGAYRFDRNTPEDLAPRHTVMGLTLRYPFTADEADGFAIPVLHHVD